MKKFMKHLGDNLNKLNEHSGEPLKIIFLDIDGVMNHEKSTEDMDSSCLYQLKRIVDATNAKIVLSSSWRLYFLRGDQNPVKQYFEKRLNLFGMEVYDITPNIGSSMRALEINKWLKENNSAAQYVILDDSMFPGFHKMKNHLCMTNWSAGGLTAEHADQAIRILNQK